MEMRRDDVGGVDRPETWVPWPVSWSAVWVGALAAFATALIIGLVGIAVGAQVVRGEPWVKLTNIGLGALIFSVFGAFLAFVVGGWVAGKIAGIRRSEPAMLHGAIVWLVGVPLLVAAAALGAGNYFGGWYGGLAGRPAWAAAEEVKHNPAATEAERQQAAEEQLRAADAARNTAIGAVTALLLGLVGGVIGGWMASGEPMTFTYHRTRPLRTATPANATVASRF
jgi:hypothetical protein